MARMQIPTVGTVMTLTKDWTFQLFHESSNHSLVLAMGLPYEEEGFGPGGHFFRVDSVMLPAGTVLRVSRIYIRKGKGDFDSITFTILSSPVDLPLTPFWMSKRIVKKHNFWAKLVDVNNIEYEFDPATIAS